VAALGTAGRTIGRPAVLTVHSGLAPPFVRAHPARVRRICDRYTCVVAVNRHIAEALIAVGHPANRLEVSPAFSPTGLAFRLAPPGLAQIRRRHQPLLAAAVVAGAPEYGHDLLLDAFVQIRHKHTDAGLILYGPGTRTPEFAAEVSARQGAKAVHLLGALDRPRALAVVAAADLFVRPTRADGDAISVREALALGCPVAASDVGNRPPAAHRFPAGSARACAEAVFHILGNRAARTVPKSASGSDCIPTLLAIYRRCGLELG
jgi:glycosyltransferase involved in cell wall biosynthesis